MSDKQMMCPYCGMEPVSATDGGRRGVYRCSNTDELHRWTEADPLVKSIRRVQSELNQALEFIGETDVKDIGKRGVKPEGVGFKEYLSSKIELQKLRDELKRLRDVTTWRTAGEKPGRTGFYLILFRTGNAVSVREAYYNNHRDCWLINGVEIEPPEWRQLPAPPEADHE